LGVGAVGNETRDSKQILYLEHYLYGEKSASGKAPKYRAVPREISTRVSKFSTERIGCLIFVL